MRHQTSQHGAGNGLQNFEVDFSNIRSLGSDESDTRSLREEYNNFRSHILAPNQTSENRSVYNYPTNDLSNGMEEIENHLREIFENEQNSFKINIAIGMILRNIDNNEARYYIPFENEMLLKRRN